MRSKEERRKCKGGHEGKFEKLNGNFYKCENCGAIVGKEFVKTKGG